MQQYADTYLLQSFAVNKYLHTVASGWIFYSHWITMHGTTSLKFYFILLTLYLLIGGKEGV